MDRADLFDSQRFGHGRSAPELTALLLELGRLVKARRFYAPGDPRLVKLFERGLRAWQADLARHGALELAVGPEGFRAGPEGELLPARQLAELVQELVAGGVSRVRLDADIDAEALAGLVEVLAADRGAIESQGGPAAALYARVPMGIVLDTLDSRKARGTLAAGDPPAAEEDDLPWTLEDEAEIGSSRAPEAEPTDFLAPEESLTELSEAEVAWEIEDEPVADLSASHGPRRDQEVPAEETAEPTGPRRRRSAADPLSLEALLEELDECDEASSYADAARRVVHEAERATEEGRLDEAFQVLRRLSQHAAQGRKRSARQADLAQSFLVTVASGPRLADLIDRACAPDHDVSVHAAQVLLQLGEDVAATLVQAAEIERDRARRERIHGILIALGDKALPELLRLIDDGATPSVRTAVRLLGDIQNPAATPMLVALLDHAEPSIREEAAKALVRTGDVRGMDALVRALRSKTPGLTAVAVYCLAASGSPRAVGPLIELVEEAAREGRSEVAREAIRALGRLGRQEAAGPLAELLLRKGLLHRRRLRELKVAAAAALGCLPGDEAVGALAQAVGSRDGQIRRAAQLALERRAQALAAARTGSLGRSQPGG